MTKDKPDQNVPFWTNPLAAPMAANAMSAWEKMLETVSGSLDAMWQAQQASLTATMRTLELMTNIYARLWGGTAQEVLPADKRFQDSAWSKNPAFDLLKQSYLITSQWMVDMADSLAELDPALHQRAQFWSKQIADALSPTNLALTNPVVLQETIRTGGTNLLQGMQNFLADVQRGRVSQVSADAFEVGQDLAITPGKVVYRNPVIELIQYTPATDQVHAVPILVIPPWINKYYVMDMRPENSMFKHLVEAGFTLFTISWKNPDQSVLDLDWEDYMTQGPLDALRVIKAITGAERVNTIGYCIGGIMQQVTLAYMAATGDQTANSTTYLATHQDFSDAGDIAVFLSEPEIKFLEWLMAVSGGYLDGRNMAATFNMLRANDLLWHYVVHNYLMGREPPAFDLLYWNSDGTRLPGRVHSFLVRKFFLENKLIEPDGLQMKGVGIDVRRITAPTYTVAALRDHIVPWRGSFKMRELASGPLRFILTAGGHIAGIINPPGHKKRPYWTNESETTDPDEWLADATKHEGSWWVDWVSWLEERSGELGPPPSMGSDEFVPLMDAPGSYVLET
jgi:polyhydroxyalkanoate synthase